MTKKRLTDEIIITALITEGSAKAAAASLGCTARTLYERMKKPNFKELYARTKGEVLKQATAKLQGELIKSIQSLAEIRDDKEPPKQTRANCAVSILQYTARFTETTDIIERLEAIEEAQSMDNVV